MVLTQTETITRGYRPKPWIYEATGIETSLSDSYSEILNVDLEEWPLTKLIVITNTHTSNKLVYSIFGTVVGSPSSSDWITLVGTNGVTKEITLDGSTSDYQTTDLPWRRLKVECKNETAGSNASVKIIIRSAIESR